MTDQGKQNELVRKLAEQCALEWNRFASGSLPHVIARIFTAALPELTREAVKDEREGCARLASNPYSDEVIAFGPDEPLAVGEKIAIAIRERRKPTKRKRSQ